MLSGIKQQVVVGKDGKIEIQTSEYLLSTEANRYHLMTAIQNLETKTNLVSFTLEEWNEEYNIRSY